MARYQAGSYDLDGKEYVVGTNISEIRHIDLTASAPFNDPVTYAHWGAAADGYFYANGAKCALGALALDASNLNPQSWRYANIDPYAASLCAIGAITPVTAGKVHFELLTGAANNDTLRADSLYKWFVTSDVDVQLDFTDFALGAIPSTPGSSFGTATFGSDTFYANAAGSGALSLRLELHYRTSATGSCAAVVTRSYSLSYGHCYTGYTLNSGITTHSRTAGVTASASGSLRITRTGSAINFYHKEGGTWTPFGSAASASGNIETGLCFVRITLHTDGSAGSVDVSNISIPAGNPSSLVGWAREVGGTHRGTMAAMPSKLLALTTQDSTSLINVTAANPAQHTLWLRPIRAANCALPTAATSRPLRTAFANGRLLIAQGDLPPNTSEYGAVLFDFVKDEVLAHRAPHGKKYAAYAPYGTGGIASRNAAAGYTDLSNAVYSLPNSRVRDVAFFIEDAWEYRAFALADTVYGGPALYAEKPSYVLQTPTAARASHATIVRQVLFASDGTLLYTDAATIYSVSKATWQAALAVSSSLGTFPYTGTKGLPGSTRDVDGLYRVALSATTLYAADCYLVYGASWPSGEFTALYGKTGSSALYPILPQAAARLRSLTLLTIGSDLLMLLSAVSQTGQGFLYLINTAFHALLDVLEITDDIGSPVEAILHA